MDSVVPCTKYLTFGPWIYLVPQYKPSSVLILGAHGGTVAKLIKLIHGDVPITEIDIKDGVDAKDYVKTCDHFDTVVVDLFQDDKICDFINTKDFVDDLSKIANYIIVNTIEPSDLSVWDLELVAIERPARLHNEIYYFQTNKIPDLCIPV